MIARVSVVVRRDPVTVVDFVSEPSALLPHMTGLGRFRHHAGQEWDAFLDIGAINVGGRILIDTHADGVTWRSVRGTRHTFALVVTPEGEHARITMSMDFRLAGLLLSRIAEVLGRGIAQRHLEAAAQQVRHHLEFEV